MITWQITKALHGILAGVVVTDTLTADASLPAPFTAGQQVDGIGGSYTVLAVSA